MTHIPKRAFAVLRARCIFLLGSLAVALAACGGCDEERERFEPDESVDAGHDSGSTPGLPDGSASACDEARQQKRPLGCEYAMFAFAIYDVTISCTGVFVSNPNEEPVALKLTREETNLELSGPSGAARLITAFGKDPGYEPLEDATLPPHASAVILLVQGRSDTAGFCPFPAAVRSDRAGVDKDRRSSAFMLTSTLPVFASYVFPYGQADFPAGETAAPLRSVGSWAREYVDVGVFQPGRPAVMRDDGGTTFPGEHFVAFAGILATEPLRLSAAGDGGPLSLFLDAGEVYRLQRDDEFIGTSLSGDKPFGLVMGSPATRVPYEYGGGDPIYHQVAPPSAWGSEYAAARYPDRYEGVTDSAVWRIVAERDGTTLAYDPAPPPGAPSSLRKGELAVFYASEPFVVRSQDEAHRFHLSMLMTGADRYTPPEDLARGVGGRGDPELVSVPPYDEWGTTFAFAAEHVYPVSNLVLVRRKVDGVFADVELACAGTVTGWTAIDGQGNYETATVRLSDGKFEGQVYPGGQCNNGAHFMRSTQPITGYLWAWGRDGVYDDPWTNGSGVSFGQALFGLPKSASSPPK